MQFVKGTVSRWLFADKESAIFGLEEAMKHGCRESSVMNDI